MKLVRTEGRAWEVLRRRDAPGTLGSPGPRFQEPHLLEPVSFFFLFPRELCNVWRTASVSTATRRRRFYCVCVLWVKVFCVQRRPTTPERNSLFRRLNGEINRFFDFSRRTSRPKVSTGQVTHKSAAGNRRMGNGRGRKARRFRKFPRRRRPPMKPAMPPTRGAESQRGPKVPGENGPRW